MKTIALAAALALLSTSAFAFGVPYVTADNPDIPNCTVLSHPEGCENVLTFKNGFVGGYGVTMICDGYGNCARAHSD